MSHVPSVKMAAMSAMSRTGSAGTMNVMITLSDELTSRVQRLVDRIERGEDARLLDSDARLVDPDVQALIDLIGQAGVPRLPILDRKPDSPAP
jgi:hypothetical protein